VRLKFVASAVAALATLFGLVFAGAAASTPRTIGKPLTATFGSASLVAGARTVPTFTDSFTFNGVTYPYTMVGTNPHTSTATTTVPTEIVPLRFVFADGTVLDGTPRVASLVASPLFQPAAFSSGVTQYGDAIQRAEFWQSVNANGGGYHALLGQPTILPTLTLRVPSAQAVVGTFNGVPFGLIDIQWFFFSVIQNLIGSQHYDPATLPIFVSDGVYLDFHRNPNACCVFGFHGVISNSIGPVNGDGHQKINTFAWASWLYPQLFGPGFDNVNGFSHEFSEWYNDPLLNNIVPTWFSPLAPQYGCSNLLEVGDPLVGLSFNVNGYSLQDEAFKSWFAHDVPSEGINGRYSYLGTFGSPSPLC
jgi:hypothetical protein